MTVLLTGFILRLCHGAALGNLPLIMTSVVSCVACAVTLPAVLRSGKGTTSDRAYRHSVRSDPPCS